MLNTNFYHRDTMRIADLIQCLSNSYQNIDLRMIAVTNDNIHWNLGFCRILFTGMDDDSLRKNDSELQFFKSLHPRVKFVREIIGLKKLQSFLTTVNSGIFETNGIKLGFSCKEQQSIFDDLAVGSLMNPFAYSIYLREDSPDHYPGLLIRPFIDKTCEDILEEHNIPNMISGFKRPEIMDSFLETQGINVSNARIVFLLPIYCRFVDSTFNTILVHRSLINTCSLRITNRGIKSHNLSELIKDRKEAMIKLDIHSILDDSNHIQLFQNCLGIEIERREKNPNKIIKLETKSYDALDDIEIKVKKNENHFLEKKISLIYDHHKNCIL